MRAGGRIVAGGVGFLLACSAARAQDAELPEYVVTAARGESAPHRVAADAITLTGEQIRSAGCLTLVDGLEQLAGVHVRSVTGNPTAAEVSLRGFGENSHGRVLVLLNGRRLNRPDMATINWLAIPLNGIEKVEIVRGAQTALYGDNAVGGVIHIFTKQGAERSAAGASVDVAGYGATALRGNASGQAGDVSFSANAEHFAADGFRDRSAFLSWGGGASAGWRIADAAGARLNVAWQRVDNELPGGLGKDEARRHPRRSLNPSDEIGTTHLNADLGLDWSAGTRHRLDATAGYGLKDMESDMASWSTFTDVRVESLAFSPRYTFKSDLFGRANRALAGADVSLDSLELDRFGSVGRTNRLGDAVARKQAVGGYIRDEFNLLPDLILALGGRAETVRVDAEVNAAGARTVDDHVNHDATAFDASVLKHFDTHSKLFARVSTLYRYPFVDEQVRYWGWGDTFLKQLDPEQGWSTEIGGEYGAVEGLTAALTLFYSEMRDEIAYNAVTMQNENMDATRRQGAEAHAKYRLPFATVRGYYAYTEAQFTGGANDGKDVPLVPQHRAGLGVQVPLPWGLRMEADARYVGECFIGGDNANAADKLRDYTVADLFLRFTPRKPSGLEAYVGAENVFDETYSPYAYSGGGWLPDAYYPAPGTTLRCGVSCRF